MPGEEPLKRLSEYLTAFIEGLTRPSLPALAGMILVAGASLAACFWLITPELFSGPGYGYFVENVNDEYSFISADVLRLQQNPPDDPVVLYFGTSSLREALSSRGHLEELLQERLDRKVKVLNLTAGGLTHWEITAMLDGLLEDIKGVVVLPCSPAVLNESGDRLDEITQSPRLALFSPDLQEERELLGFEKRGELSGNFFRDNYRFFVARLVPVLRHALKGRQWRDFHAGDKWRDPNEAEMAGFIRLRGQWVDEIAERGDLNAEAYRRILGRIRENPDLNVVLLASVSNPKTNDWVRSLPGYPAAQGRYEGYVESFLAGERTIYRDYEAPLGLAPEDFKDTVHFKNPKARERFTEYLADDLAEIFRAGPELMEAP